MCKVWSAWPPPKLMTPPTTTTPTAYRDDLLDLPLGGKAAEPTTPVADEGPHADPLPGRRPPAPPPGPSRRWPIWLLLAVVITAAAAAVAAWLLKPSPAVLMPGEPMLDFQDVRLGDASSRSLSITNRGEAPLAMMRTDLGGADAADFAVVADRCSGTRLAQGETCELEVSFGPTARGRRAATLVLEAEAANAPRTVPLLGHGTAPELSVSTGSVAFDAQLLGTASGDVEVRVVNRGTSAMTLASVSIEGLAAGDFAVRGRRCRDRTLPPGAGCTIAVRFLPTLAGPREAVLWLRSAGGDAAQVALRGDSLAPEPLLRLGATRLDLGVVPVGETSPAASLVISNDGSGPLALEALELIDDAGVFSVDAAGCSVEPIAPAGGCTAAVVAKPQGIGPQSAVLRVVHADGAGEVTLSAVGVAPQIRIAPVRIGLGEVPIGHRVASDPVRVENVGMAPLRLDRLVLEGKDVSAFGLRDDACSGATLETGQACTVRIGLAPRRPGPLRATLMVAHNAGREQVPVTGFGVAGRIAVEPDRLVFDATQVGASRERRVVVRNRGRAPLAIRAPQLEGTGTAAFRLAGSTCSGPLAPSMTCTVTVTYIPRAAGGQEATLVLAHDGDGPAVRLAVSGRAEPRPAPRLAASPTSLDFGDVPVLARSEIETVRLTNAGDGNLELRDLRITGSHAADFRIVPGSCAASGLMMAGVSCTVGVQFTPSGPGRREARLELVHRAEGTRAVGLIGSGL